MSAIYQPDEKEYNERWMKPIEQGAPVTREAQLTAALNDIIKRWEGTDDCSSAVARAKALLARFTEEDEAF